LRLKYFKVNFLPSVCSSNSSSGSGRQCQFYDDVQLELLDAEFARDSFANREGRRRRRIATRFNNWTNTE
jgi:hypothetical protein